MLDCTKISTNCFVLEASVEGKFKIEFVLPLLLHQYARWKKINFHVKLWTNGKNYSRLSITKNLKRDKAISTGFAQKGPVREFDIWNVFKKDLHGVQFFFSIQVIESQLCLWICQNFSTSLSKILQKYLKNCFFPSFSSSVILEIEASSKKM